MDHKAFITKDWVIFSLPGSFYFQGIAGNTHPVSWQELPEHSFIFHDHSAVTEQLLAITGASFDPAEMPDDMLPLHPNGVPDTTMEQYRHTVEYLQSAIASGKIDKGVASRTRFFPFANRFDVYQFLQNLRKNHPLSFVYALKTGDECWIGASPELLLKNRNGKLETVALAGTSRIDENRNWSRKEKDEQEWVSRHIRELLREKGLVFTENGPQEYENPPVKHLVTHFSWSSDQPGTIGMIRRLHPTPAVAGYPSQAALEAYQQAEHHPRKYYTGFIGWYENGTNYTVHVNLRCGQIFREGLLLYTGAGITSASEWKAEWAETGHKMQVLLRSL